MATALGLTSGCRGRFLKCLSELESSEMKNKRK